MKSLSGNIALFTIGYSKKKAEEFFQLLIQAKISLLIDVRLNNQSQLAGFTKKNDLPYFLQTICSCAYKHIPQWAPTKDILDDYKKKNITWPEYSERFLELVKQRAIEKEAQLLNLDHACFLCSEPQADKCHRRLVAEYLQKKIGNLSITHL